MLTYSEDLAELGLEPGDLDVIEDGAPIPDSASSFVASLETRRPYFQRADVLPSWAAGIRIDCDECRPNVCAQFDEVPLDRPSGLEFAKNAVFMVDEDARAWIGFDNGALIEASGSEPALRLVHTLPFGMKTGALTERYLVPGEKAGVVR